jgi:hypothetical protein
MSFLNSPQYASVTTRLLALVDDVMPRRHQAITAALVGFIALSASIGSVLSRPARTSAQPPPPIVLVATPTLAYASGLVKVAAPLAVRSAPTAAPPAIPTAETLQVLHQAAARPHERPSDKHGPGDRP